VWGGDEARWLGASGRRAELELPLRI
jgi:hypothetical protein